MKELLRHTVIVLVALAAQLAATLLIFGPPIVLYIAEGAH